MELQGKEHSQTHSTRSPSPWHQNQTKILQKKKRNRGRKSVRKILKFSKIKWQGSELKPGSEDGMEKTDLGKVKEVKIWTWEMSEEVSLRNPSLALGYLVHGHTIHQAKKDGRIMFGRTNMGWFSDMLSCTYFGLQWWWRRNQSSGLHLRVLSTYVGAMEERWVSKWEHTEGREPRTDL